MEKIHGQTAGLKSSELKALSRLYRRRVLPRQVATVELVSAMTQMAHAIGRPVSVLVSRRGQVTAVGVGGNGDIGLPSLRKREAATRLSGLRAVIVHPRGGALTKDELVTLAMERLDLFAAVEAEGGTLHRAEVWMAHLEPEPDEAGSIWRTHEPMGVRDALEKFDVESFLADLEDRFSRHTQHRRVDTGKETVVLVGVATPKDENWLVEDALDELSALAQTAGAQVLSRVVQRRATPDPGTYLGRGKVEELALRCRELGASTVIVDAELTPSQQANLEREMGVKVVDRPGLILDIFAQRAQTREGKLQVELAQLQYLLPRLTGASTALSRLGGGIGTRGPGETKLEVDRRRIRERIAHLEDEVDVIKRQRSAQRRSRQRHGAVLVALVGYTNAGKSTLLNALTRSDVLAEDKLFATLDPTTRKLPPSALGLAGGEQPDVLLTDTVGFLQRLPHQLVAAFRATLEEVSDADVLVHVVDASHPQHAEQIKAVHEVLDELEAGDKPTIMVLNKIDRVADPDDRAALELRFPEAVLLSAKHRDGFETLLSRLGDQVAGLVRQPAS